MRIDDFEDLTLLEDALEREIVELTDRIQKDIKSPSGIVDYSTDIVRVAKMLKEVKDVLYGTE